jgi:hypothetical protein
MSFYNPWGFRVGDKVRLKDGVVPYFNWGTLTDGHEIGMVTKSDSSVYQGISFLYLRIAFPSAPEWYALPNELELVEPKTEFLPKIRLIRFRRRLK